MSILWYDFSASSNGSGTYASPYNGASAVSFASLGSGDEVRIKSHSIASLTDFTFTGSYSITSSTSFAPYVDVADASLFTVGDIIMVDSDKTCFRIDSLDTSSTPNKIKMDTDFHKWPATMVWGVTNATFRRIDPAYYSISKAHCYLGNSNAPSAAITISDGWHSETARVSDQSYITLVADYQAGTAGANFYINSAGDGTTLNLQNTCFIADKGTASANLYLQNNADNLTTTLHQYWGAKYGGIKLNNTDGQNLTMNYFSSFYGPASSGGIYGNNQTVTINNYRPTQTYYDNRSGGDNITLKIKNLSAHSLTGSVWDYSYKSGHYVYDGSWKVGSNNNAPNFFQFGGTADFTSNFSLTTNNYGGNTPNSITTLPLIIDEQYINKTRVERIVSPVTNNSGLTITLPAKFSPAVQSNKEWADRTGHKANVHDFYYVYDSSLVQKGATSVPELASSYIRDINVANSEYEVLGSSTITESHGIKITKDTSFYKTTSPSLKCNLPTYSSTYSNMEFVKVIDIPVNGNNSTEFTVTGWVKSDSGMFATDKLKARVVYDDKVAVTQNINITNAEAGWVQFSLAFTPNDKQIAQFQLRMHPQAGAKSVWLSDVAVA